MIYIGVRESIRAEDNLHATLFVIRLVEQFVDENGRWPKSWSELEQMQFPSDAPSPLHGFPAPKPGEATVVRIGGQHGFDWPDQSQFLQECVAIDFDPDIAAIANQDPMDFEAIKPIGPYYEYRYYGFVESLQETLRSASGHDVEILSASPGSALREQSGNASPVP